MRNLENKRIFLYMNFFKDDESIGITKKIKAQISTLRRMGLDVTYTSYVDDGVVILNNNDEVIFESKYSIPIAIYRRFRRRFLLIKAVNKYLESEAPHFDYGYLRWHTFDKPYLRMLRNLKNAGAENIIEAHAYTPDQKAVNLLSRWQIANDKKYSAYAKDYASLIAAMSEYDSIWGIKTVKVDNAIDLTKVTERHWNRNQDTLRIISVSNEYIYHGYDRLLKGLRNYYDAGGERKIEVHFIGVNRPDTKHLVEQLNLSAIVHFHGKQFGPALDVLYDNSDLGIGALAHHRIGMYAGSSLKTKEYFAKGLPCIYGWKEPAFDETYPYALKIELNEEPLDMEQVIKFYDGIKDDPNMLTNMREFAKEHYSWENEFKKIFEALDK